jgi:hypothetical protein
VRIALPVEARLPVSGIEKPILIGSAACTLIPHDAVNAMMKAAMAARRTS